MDRPADITLIAKSYEKDDIGQQIETETERTVPCTLTSVSRQEWQAAGQQGFQPSKRAIVFTDDYQDEDAARIDGVLYSVYRTYEGDDDRTELYLEKKAKDYE